MSTCLNCGSALAGPYCSTCGQKVRAPDPSLGDFLRETTQELTHWDGKVPTTLKQLLTRPGELTRDFLAGRRARWLAPLRLYLICSIAYFLTASAVEYVTNRPGRQVVQVGVRYGSGEDLTPEQRADIENSAIARALGPERVKRLLDNGADFNRTMTKAFPKAMFLLLPLFALLTSVAWRRAAPRYPAHLYLALHVHAAAFAALTAAKLTTLPGWTAFEVAAGITALGYIGWHAFRAARVVFGGSFGRTLGKAMAVGVVYWMCFMIVTIGLMAYSFATL